MEVKLADTAGFCMGVRRAVDIVLEIAQHETGRHIYTYGPLIHSPQTIELLKSRGVNPIRSIDEIKDKHKTVLIIRAHGIAPEERKKIKDSGIRIIDATCPKVGYVQAIIKKHASLDYTVIIVGDREHPEVDGLLGYTGGRGIVVATEEEVDELPRLDKVCIVAQTTQDLDNYRRIVDKLKTLYPDTIVFNTICSSTEQRQLEVVAMAEDMDALFIVGGKNSANTRRLFDLASHKLTSTFHIETAAELDNINIEPYNRIGVSAGASTPNWIIDRVIEKIAQKQNKKLKIIGPLINSWLWAVKTDVYSALGAACLCLACMYLQNIQPDISAVAVAAFFVHAVHVLNRLLGAKPGEILGSFQEESYIKYEKHYYLFAVFSLVLALSLSLINGLLPFAVLFLISIAGIFYNMKIMPFSWRFQRLKDLPGSKNIFMAAAWGIVTAVLPPLSGEFSLNMGLVVAFVFTLSLVFIRSAMSDMLDIQSDRLIGRETIPVLIGKERTRIVLKFISLILLVILLVSYPMKWTSSLSFALLFCVLYVWICFRLCDRKSRLSGAVMEGLLETSYIIAGFSVILWFILR